MDWIITVLLLLLSASPFLALGAHIWWTWVTETEREKAEAHQA